MRRQHHPIFDISLRHSGAAILGLFLALAATPTAVHGADHHSITPRLAKVLEDPGHPARLDVYDVRGRLVRRLNDGRRTLPGGPHSFAWDGRNAQGRDVSSGIYFVRLSAGGVVECRKLAVVR